MTHRSIRNATTVSLLALAAAGCSSADSIAPPTQGGTTPTPAPAVAFEQRFGTAFASFFTASNTSDPRDPQASDVPALNATADALDN